MAHNNKTNKKNIVVLICMAMSFFTPNIESKAQDTWLFENVVRDDHDTEDSFLGLNAKLDGQFFFKNNEYFAPAAEGYTLVGYTLRPVVIWHMNERISLHGGLHALRYGGENSTKKIYPFFATTWHINDSLNLRIGNLLGPASHGLPEALSDPEENYVSAPEFGAQLSFDIRNFRGHAWLNWRQFIHMGDTIPEKFTAGVHTNFHSGKFYLPFGLLFNHIGGQISDYSEPMQSLLNAHLSPSIFLFGYKFKACLHMMGFHTMAGKKVRPFERGWVLQPELSLRHEIFKLDVSWFRSHNFYAPQGNPLLMSVSNYKADVYERNRSLIIGKANLNVPIGEFTRFNLCLGAYYDTFATRFDYSYGFAMVVSPHI